ncbi:MAG: AMP-binding protein [Myxococcota bacterium]|jgi:fatty-acyl-CoA synthase|nr:long-chain fatty acid--CoA ligase [bacterium]MDP6073654.1 AMP-binding protein [Myxococcota bacterium]MDP6242045.1 AMP-binding protein [Myxococcota bacterium]MDP7074172.1 AMP-binding protein [Myxococcota bacterium]MDP7299821.1 AMP-binding protein [Myxococcota bacterium]
MSTPQVDANVASWILRHANERGSQLALVDGERRLDYAGLEARVRRCAGVLASRGVGRGDRVALVLRNGIAYLELVLATARLGAIATPLNARLTPREIGGLLADCSPRLLVHDRETGISGDWELLDTRTYETAMSVARSVDAIAAVRPEDPMLLMYTSGTTGRPKGALLPHRKTLYNARNAEIFFGLTARDRVLVALPLFHSFGLKILALPTLYAGGRIVLERRFVAHEAWNTVDREGISFFGGVPSMFRELLEALGPERDLSSLRFLFTAGSAIPVELIRCFEAQGLVMKQGFGQTETSILYCLDAKDAVRKAGSVGLPVRHAEVRVVQRENIDGPPEAWRNVAPGETGEIVVRGPILMTGYWGRPEATAEVMRGQWLRTGDLATLDEEGFATLVGRAHDMYISGGENVYPAEIEAVYEAHPSLRDVAVVGVPDERWGEVGHAFCVLEAGAVLPSDALRRWGAERLADFKLPKRFIAVPELPRTETGKVMKHALNR